MYNNLRDIFSLTFAGRPLPTGFVLEDVIRDFVGDIENYTSIRPGRSGHFFRRRKLGMKRVVVKIRIIEDGEYLRRDNRQKIRERVDYLRSFFVKKRPEKLYITDYPRQYDLAILDSSAIEYGGGNSALITLSFLCPSGVSYANAESVVELVPGRNVYNPGNEETPFVLTGKASSPAIEVESETTGEIFQISRAIVGKEIEIDTDQETYKEGGLYRMIKVLPESDAPFLLPGDNAIRVSGVAEPVVHFRGWYL